MTPETQIKVSGDWSFPSGAFRHRFLPCGKAKSSRV